MTHEWKELVLKYLFQEQEDKAKNVIEAKESHNDNEVEIIKETKNEDAVPAAEGNIPKQVSFTPSTTNIKTTSSTVAPVPTTPSNTPSQMPTQVTMSPPILPPATPPTAITPFKQKQVQDLTLEQFVTVVATTAQTAIETAKEAATTKEQKTEKVSENLGMCKTTYARLLLWCGLSPGEDDEIPALWKLLSDKEMKTPMKKSIINQWIASHEYFEDTKVIMYAPLTKMIVDMDFEEDTTRASRKSAAKGLTPFAVPTLSDSEVDAIEDFAEAMEVATQTTVKDIEKSGIMAEGPKSFSGLKIILRRFANLLNALFGIHCPLF